MRHLISDSSNDRAPSHGLGGGNYSSAPLLEVLWRRRLTLIVTVFGFLVLTAAFLYVTAPTYRATARLSVREHAPRILNESRDFAAPSENFLETQATIAGSGPVLTRALRSINTGPMLTFAALNQDPVNWLRQNSGLRIEPGRKSDLLTVTMDAHTPDEAAEIANAVARAYIDEQTERQRSSGQDMLSVLRQEQHELTAQRQACVDAIQAIKIKHGLSNLREDRNAFSDRAASLATAYNAAQIATIELRAQKGATEQALRDPSSASAFVYALQARGRDLGDKEYADLRAQLAQFTVELSTSQSLQGEKNPRIQMLRAHVDSLKQRIEEKELTIARAALLELDAQLTAAEAKERQLKESLQAQRTEVLEMSPDVVEFGRLESELARLQTQSQLVDARAAEIAVNAVQSPTLNIQVVDWATPMLDPVKPNKKLALAAALLAGVIAGVGLSLVREWRDSRLRTPEDVLSMLGTPVLATVPRINNRLSPVARGQLVHLDARSPVAEAYRSIRTALDLGVGRESRTVLVASPTPGDGKSTTASNLAIALAQAGQRTLLIDCDLRSPVQHMIFETDASVGLTSVIGGEAKLGQAVRGTRVSGLYVLPCGPVPANPAELLSSKRFKQLLEALSASFDRVVLDCPPLMTVTDGHILAAGADATLLVLRMNQSLRQMGVLALEQLERVGARVLGAVANDVASSRGPHYYNGSWQYATSPRRLMASVGMNGKGGNGHGEMLPSRVIANRRPADDTLLDLSEPDWSAEPRGR